MKIHFTGLSKPFRRLDKYAAMLQELERHMELGHPDRGDTQRSIIIYKDIAVSLFILFHFDPKLNFHFMPTPQLVLAVKLTK